MSSYPAPLGQQLYAPEPGWLTAKPGEVFCWFHQPDKPGRKQGVILCDTLGSERMSLHLAYRYLALELCRAGFPVLRIDYHGTADSGGDPREPDRLRAWLDSLHAGCDYLKQRAGVSELAAFGAHFGGTLAALLAAERADVKELLLWGAFLRGRDFLRSAKAFERLAGGNPDKRRPQYWQEDDLEVVGFLYTRETVESLQGVDLSQVATEGLQRACILEWDDYSDSSKLAAHFNAQGVCVEHIERPIADAEACLQRQAVPQAIISKALEFFSASTGADESNASPAALRLTLEFTLPGQGGVADTIESVESFGPQQKIFAIVTRPATSIPSRENSPWIVIVNGGNNHRCGINRNHTEWARCWAAEGFTVVRMDIRGLGDSPPESAQDLNKLYRVATKHDIRMVMDSIQSKYGAERFILGGLCAGAFQSMQAARNDGRVVGLWLIELLRFYHHDHHNIIRRLRKLRRVIVHALSMENSIVAPPMARWLKRLDSRGTKTLIIYQGKQSILEEFLAESSNGPARLRNCTLHLLRQSNHIVSPLHSQDELRSELKGWMTSQF